MSILLMWFIVAAVASVSVAIIAIVLGRRAQARDPRGDSAPVQDWWGARPFFIAQWAMPLVLLFLLPAITMLSQHDEGGWGPLIIGFWMIPVVPFLYVPSIISLWDAESRRAGWMRRPVALGLGSMWLAMIALVFALVANNDLYAMASQSMARFDTVAWERVASVVLLAISAIIPIAWGWAVVQSTLGVRASRASSRLAGAPAAP